MAAGFKHIDAVSFVSPKAVPQMADSEKVLKELDPPDDVEIIGIVVNEKGAERAIATEPCRRWDFPIRSLLHFWNNQNQNLEEAIESLENVEQKAVMPEGELVVYISMAFGNPYGDLWNVDEVIEAVDSGGNAQSTSFPCRHSGDGVSSTDRRFGGSSDRTIPSSGNRRSSTQPQPARPKKNKAAYNAGCRRFDSALGGFGGCPFAQDELVGNIPTETVLSSPGGTGGAPSRSASRWTTC